MKRTVTQILAILIFTVFFVSCDDDNEDLQKTGKNGQPSGITYDDANVYFYYQGGKLSRIREIGGSVSYFSYENNELVSVSFFPDNKDVQDGSGTTSFRKEGSNKIIIESSGEPSSALFRWELDLDENNTPLKITEIGIFDRTGANGDFSKIIDGEYYAIFTYDSGNKNLIKQTLYNKSTEEIVTTYSYEYDSNFGILSKIDLPLWFYAYRAYNVRESRYAYNRIYFNYYNNLIEETISKDDVTEYSVFNYNYRYNHGNAPVFMNGDTPGRISLSITY